jgi:hypothetical protein
MLLNTDHRPGNMKWGVIGLLLGLPLPIIILMWLFLGN